MSKMAPFMVFMIGHRIGKLIKKIIRIIRPLPPDPCPDEY